MIPLYLPPETLDNIIGFVPVDDKETLMSCSLTSHSLCAIARPFLFHFIQIDLGREDLGLTPFMSFVVTSPHLAEYIRHLHITDETAYLIGSKDYQVSATNLHLTLLSLPRLQSLDLDMVVVSGGDLFLDPLPFQPTDITFLRLDCALMSEEGAVLEILNLFNHVEEFHVENLPIADLPVASFIGLDMFVPFPSYPNIRDANFRIAVTHLHIGPSPDSDPDGTMIFLQVLQKSPSMQTLTSVTIRIDHYVIAAELGKMLRSCGARIQYCELDFRLPYYEKRTREAWCECSGCCQREQI